MKGYGSYAVLLGYYFCKQVPQLCRIDRVYPLQSPLTKSPIKLYVCEAWFSVPNCTVAGWEARLRNVPNSRGSVDSCSVSDGIVDVACLEVRCGAPVAVGGPSRCEVDTQIGFPVNGSVKLTGSSAAVGSGPVLIELSSGLRYIDVSPYTIHMEFCWY